MNVFHCHDAAWGSAATAEAAACLQSFARDLEGIFAELQQIDPQMIASRQEGGVSFAASMAADDSSVNRLLIQVCISVCALPTRHSCMGCCMLVLRCGCHGL